MVILNGHTFNNKRLNMSWHEILDKADKILEELEDNQKSNLEECHDKINKILLEYNCSLYSIDNYIYLKDNDEQN